MLQAIKKRALYTLTDRGIPKTHDKFRELYSWVTRGVGFGLVSPSLLSSVILRILLPSVLIKCVKTFV